MCPKTAHSTCALKLRRPAERLDPGKKYRVLLFNDEQNTREYVMEVLIKYIPGMDAVKAKEITARAHNTGRYWCMRP